MKRIHLHSELKEKVDSSTLLKFRIFDHAS